MKKKNVKFHKLSLLVVLLSLFAPALILPRVGLIDLRADDCPGNLEAPANPNNGITLSGSGPMGAISGAVTYTQVLGEMSADFPFKDGPGTYGIKPGPRSSGGGGWYLIKAFPPTPAAPAAATATVSPIDGAFVYSATDLKVPGVVPLALTRVYISSLGYNGPMGYNWDYNYNRSLDIEAGAAYYHTGQGYQIQLNYTGGGTSSAQTVGPVHLTMTTQSGNYVVTDTHGTRDVFDSTGRLIETWDRNGNELTYTRDGDGRLIKVEDPVHGTYITFSFDVNGRILSATDSMGRTVSYAYDSFFDLISVTYPAVTAFPSGITYQYTYDVSDRLLTVVDGKGNTALTNVYGPQGTVHEDSLIQQKTLDPTLGVIVGSAYSYDDVNHIVTFIDYNGFKTDYYNDGSLNVIKKIVHTAGLHSGEPSTYETDYTYDSSGQNTGETDPSGKSTAITYDSNGNVLTTTVTAPSGTTVDSTKGTQSLTAVSTFTYESRFNQVASMVDSNGNETDYDYGTALSNPAGNLLKITAPTTAAGTATETFTYNSLGQVLTDTTPDGVTQYTYDVATSYLSNFIKDYGSGKLNAENQFTYDSYGNVATVQDANGNTTSFTTNALNQVTEVDGASGEVHLFTYDENGQMVTSKKKAPGSQWQEVENIYSLGNGPVTESRVYTDATNYQSTTYSYDRNGNVTKMTDPLGNGTSYLYDERNMTYKQTDALGKTVDYDYDVNGNLAKMTDELGNVSTYFYDGLDRIEQKSFADSSYQTWIYDAGGRVTSVRTTAGNTISATYDARNEVLTQNYGSTITNSYDLMGRLVTATENSTSLTYAYDALDRNTSFTDQAGRVSTYTYDLNGNRLTSAYPTSMTVKGAYDASNRLTTLKDGSNVTQATCSYDILDRPTGLTLANSTSISASFDLINRLSYIHNTLGGTSTRNYSYVYDDASRITSVTEPRGTVGISSYSSRNEVKGVTEPTGSPFAGQSFAYDAGFNRSSWTLGSTTTTYTANNLDQYTAVSGSTAPTWNSDGGLAAFSGNTYTYDALRRLTEVDNSLGKSFYSYDPFGRRVKKVVENPSGAVLATYEYHYDGNQVAVEYRPGTTWTYYGGLMRTDGTNKQWYYHDRQGTVSSVADNSGNILENYEYNVQGQLQITNGSGTVLTGSAIGNDLLYAGYRYDVETGNYFCNARYYNPTLGRFISRDPLAGAELSQGTNLYGYCGNDNANATDPSGMTTKQVLQGDDWELPGRYIFVNANSSAVDSKGPRLATNNAAQTQAIINKEIAELRPLSEYQRAKYLFNAHNILGPQDFKVHQSMQTYTVDGKVISADDFGNYLAGYAATWALGVDGQMIMSAAGIVDATSNLAAGQGLNYDQTYIWQGGNDAAADASNQNSPNYNPAFASLNAPMFTTPK